MATPTRLANKTIWALEDIIAAATDARSACRLALDRAQTRMDAAQALALARLFDDLATIDTLAREARQGRYHGT